MTGDRGPSWICPASKTGSGQHVIVDVHGIPLAAPVIDGNPNDVTQRLSRIHAVPPIRGKRGRPVSAPTSSTPTAVTTTRSTAARSSVGRLKVEQCDARHY
jgi:hypothetical protein